MLKKGDILKAVHTTLICDYKGNELTVTVPEEDTSDMYYLWERNTQKLSIATSILRDCINTTHPHDKSNIDLK